MDTRTFIAPAISCSHCTNTIEMELSALEGVIGVEAAAETQRVTVRWDPPASWETIAALLAEIGYQPAE